MSNAEQLQSFLTEMRRGTLTMMVLGCLTEPQYGYNLLQKMKEKQIEIEANTLYPLLRRLESQGILTSDWDTTEARPRKYYTISEKGEEIFTGLMAEWDKMKMSIEELRRS